MHKKADVPMAGDPEEVLGIMDNMLENRGFMIDAATRGEKALREVRECPETRLIILNYLLPDMSGLAVLGRLKENGSQVKVVAVSALNGVRQSLANAGAFAFLEEPFDILLS